MAEMQTKSANAGVLSAENYGFLQNYIQAESGISLGADKEYLVKARLMPLLDTFHLLSLDELCRQLKTPAGGRMKHS